jgi:hypothetical protein
MREQALRQPETANLDYHIPVEHGEAFDVSRIEQAQEWDDVTTQFAELVDGSMRTEFKFGLSPDGTELIGPDGRGMRETSGNFLEKAREDAEENPNLGWNLRRTEIEDEETAEAVDMANGNGPNTMIVLSDFPAELQGAEEDFGGYNITRKQTMARFYRRNDADGTIHMVTRTLDGSSRQALEAIYEELGLEPPEEGEMLGQRRRLDLTPEEQEHFDDRVTGIYDRSMTAQHGGEWYAGRRPADYRNTYDFVCGQKDIIATCIELERSGELTEATLYDMAATMQKRFEQQTEEKAGSITPRMTTVNRASLGREMLQAGQAARASGKSFSACGGTLTAGGEAGTEAAMREAGFGSAFEGKWHGGKINRNSKCVSCKDVKSEVGACYICKDCVDNPKQHKSKTERRQKREDTAQPFRIGRVSRRPS